MHDVRRSLLSVRHTSSLRGLLCFLLVTGLSLLRPGLSPSQAADGRKGAEGYRVQDLDDPLEKLVPVQPRTPTEQNRLDAAAWYMTGQIREGRTDFTGALDAYKKAIEFDPAAVRVYRALVPLAFSLNQTKDAVQYAMKAIELDPDDTEVLRRLGVHMASDRKLPEAIQLFEQAAKSKKLDPKSALYVSLKRDLAIMYAAVGQLDNSADAFEVVFDALANPRDYDIDDRTRAALLADPATTFERIGQVFLEAKRYEKAVLAFERAAKARRGKPGSINFNLARVYQQTKQYDKAIDELQKYLDAQLQSKGRAAYELLVDLLKATNKEADIIPRLEALAQKDPQNAALQYYLAEQFMAANRLEDAESLYKKTLESTKDPAGYAGLAAVYRRLGKAEDLLQALEKAVNVGGRGNQELEQSLTALEVELKAIGEDDKLLEAMIAAGRKQIASDPVKLSFPASLVLAKLAASAKKTDAVTEFYRFALKMRRDRAGLIYEELGQYLLLNNEYVESAKVFQEAAAEPALEGQKPNFLFRLSQAYAYGNETDKALEAVKSAREIVPDHPLLHYQEAWIHYHAKQWEPAIRLFEQVIAKFPEDKEIVRRSQFSLSNVYVQKGDQRKGEEVLEKILEQDPDDVSVNNDLGYLYADQGKNLEKAEKMIRKAIAAEPDNAAYLDSMGWVLYKLERYEEALPYLEKAVKTPTGSDSTLLDHLGDCYLRLNKADKAKESWEKALDHATKDSTPDAKLIERLKEKLKNQKDGSGKAKTEAAP